MKYMSRQYLSRITNVRDLWYGGGAAYGGSGSVSSVTVHQSIQSCTIIVTYVYSLGKQ